MDSPRSLQGITGPMFVNERNASRNKGGDAFREALQQQGGEGQAEQAEAERKQPLRSGLQVRRPVGRKEEDEGRHVDVFA